MIELNLQWWTNMLCRISVTTVVVYVCVSVDVGSGWMMNRISDGFNVYFNVDTMQHSWLLPESVTLDPSLLTHTDIQVLH